MNELSVPAGGAGGSETELADETEAGRLARWPAHRSAGRPRAQRGDGTGSGERPRPGAVRLRDVVRLELLALRSRSAAVSLFAVAMAGSVVLDWLWVRDAPYQVHPAVLLAAGLVALCLAWDSDARYRLTWLYGSLPVERRTVVDARYLLAALYLLAILACDAAVRALVVTPGGGDGWLSDLVWGNVGSVALLSAVPPVLLMVRGEGSWLNALLCLGIFGNGVFLPVVVASYCLAAWWPAALPPGAVSDSLVAVSSLFLFCVSWLSTRRVYTRQDH